MGRSRSAARRGQSWCAPSVYDSVRVHLIDARGRSPPLPPGAARPPSPLPRLRACPCALQRTGTQEGVVNTVLPPLSPPRDTTIAPVPSADGTSWASQ